MTQYDRLGTISFQQLQQWLESQLVKKGGRVVWNGQRVSVKSVRIKTFLAKGFRCVSCGCYGKVLAVERHRETTGPYQINVYTEDGRLLTKDHIIPVSKGGKDGYYNLQPMCSPCNCQKSDSLPTS